MDNICHTAYRSGKIGYAIDAEYRKTQLTDEMDAHSNGRARIGGDAIGEQDYKAAYIEIKQPLLDELVVKAASHYDEYSLPDAGELSSSANVHYEANET